MITPRSQSALSSRPAMDIDHDFVTPTFIGTPQRKKVVRRRLRFTDGSATKTNDNNQQYQHNEAMALSPITKPATHNHHELIASPTTSALPMVSTPCLCSRCYRKYHNYWKCPLCLRCCEKTSYCSYCNTTLTYMYLGNFLARTDAKMCVEDNMRSFC